MVHKCLIIQGHTNAKGLLGQVRVAVGDHIAGGGTTDTLGTEDRPAEALALITRAELLLEVLAGHVLLIVGR